MHKLSLNDGPKVCLIGSVRFCKRDATTQMLLNTKTVYLQ